MSRYITRERAKEAAQGAINQATGGCPGSKAIRDAVSEAIDRVPGEDISPRKSATWEPMEGE